MRIILLLLISVIFFSCSDSNIANSQNGFHEPLDNPADGPVAGNPNANYPVPSIADEIDVSNPTTIIGDGTAESITSEAFIEAVAKGGIIIFNSGGIPVTLTLNRPAKVYNDASDTVVIDGGGLITLSGGGRSRILYMNTCDPDLVWTTSHCQNQEFPQLFLQNLTFADGNSVSEEEYDGGGALWVRGGRLKIVNCRFFNNHSTYLGPDVGGGAIRVFDMYEDLPVFIANSTFGGKEGYGNVSSNGGAISSIGVSWTIYNSLFSYNKAVGNGANPAKDGTPGGGSGGAIYNDGNEMTLSLYGCHIEDNQVNEHGGAIFFVTNNHTGNVVIDSCVIKNNPGGYWYPAYNGISAHSDTEIEVTNSIIE